MRVVGRTEWGARPPRQRDSLAPEGVRGVAVHYTGMNADEQAEHANCAGRVRGIQRYHMETNGWFDIAYNHLVCKHGYVFEGRGFGVRSAANGTNDANSAYFAACFLGDDTRGRDDVTEDGRRALAELVVAYRRRYLRAREVRPHSHFFATACPGDELRSFIATADWDELARPDWPIPIPRWFWAWAQWRLRGRKGRRPAAAPRAIPAWAWRRLEALVARRRRRSTRV